MAPSYPLRVPIITMHISGASVSNISKTLWVSRKTVSETIKRYEELGSLNDRPGRGRPATATLTHNVIRVRELMQRNAKKSLRMMAKAIELSKTSMSRVVNEKVGLRSYRCQKAHILLPRSPEEWPPYSPDLNSMDHSIWSYLENEVCSEKYRSVESLKESLLKAWEEMPI
ncbi:unnamed protein product [Heligmosomoides polygyrus]|uniref:HTH_Tnp_Tc3_1 domain-containing protein n=1 Tax=Heligmosomoides polygyrus TaxID=6339 RepID=A0A183GMJ6_HELPZ|nr:unnamed protein product [Heligmosomoides polygyrus]